MARPTIAQRFNVLEDLEELGVLTEARVMAIFRRHGWKIERAGARNWLLKVGLHKEADALLRRKTKRVRVYVRQSPREFLAEIQQAKKELTEGLNLPLITERQLPAMVRKSPSRKEFEDLQAEVAELKARLEKLGG